MGNFTREKGIVESGEVWVRGVICGHTWDREKWEAGPQKEWCGENECGDVRKKRETRRMCVKINQNTPRTYTDALSNLFSVAGVGEPLSLRMLL